MFVLCVCVCGSFVFPREGTSCLVMLAVDDHCLGPSEVAKWWQSNSIRLSLFVSWNTSIKRNFPYQVFGYCKVWFIPERRNA